MPVGPKTGERRRLADLLISLGLIDRGEIQRAAALAKQSGSHLLRVIVDQGWVDEDRLTRALSSALGVEAVTPSTMKIHERVLGMIPPRLALKHRALPIAIKRANQTDFLYVALADPLDPEALDELQKASGCKLNVLIAPPTQLDAALNRFYIAQGPTERTADGPPPLPGSSPTPGSGMAPVKRGQGMPQAAPSTPPRTVVAPPTSQSSRSAPMVPDGLVLAPRQGLPQASGGLPAPTRSQPGATPAPRMTKATGSLPAPRGAGSIPPASRTVPPPPPGAQPLPSFPQRDEWPRRTSGLEAPPIPPAADTSRGMMRPAADADLVKTQLDTNLLELGASQLFEPQVVVAAPLDSGRVARAPDDASSATPPPEPPRIPARVVHLSAATGDISDADEGQSWDLDIEELVPEHEASAELASSAGLPPPRHLTRPAEDDENPVELDEVVEELEAVEEPPTSELDLADPQNARLLAPVETKPRGSDRPGENGARPQKTSMRPPPLPEPDPDEATGIEPPLELRELAPEPVLLTRDEQTHDQPRRPSYVLEEAPPEVFASTLELPMDVEDVPSPFDMMRDVHLKAGLERTGIIPAIDWERETFEPPSPAPREPSPYLAGTDIPSSREQARARLEESPPPVPAEGRRQAATAPVKEPPPPPEPEAAEPEPQRASPSVPPPPEAEAAPVNGAVHHSEPPPLELPPMPPLLPELPDLAALSLGIEEAKNPPTDPAVQMPKDQPEDVPTNPRITRDELGEALAGGVSLHVEPGPPVPPVTYDLESGPAALQGLSTEELAATRELPRLPSLPLVEPIGTKSEQDEDAHALVRGLMQGDSLTSAERAQLVLALGRILIKKGIISPEELIAAISE